ncbi:hypothetical protein SAMN05421770_101989 [Granulicella rosea]|uniref:Conjugation TrbI-like protein n=1 Tax=Granulicella rosea TaxID=474952 RepID=A0A239EI22_9BACT|nr:hypothetical protein [Granulicella rosea]SNS44209.1 hypothetical protein SAMN05421770_101989 [Granulicella rosea]
MKTTQTNLAAAALLAFATSAAFGQTSGVSHPDETVIQQQPIQDAPAATAPVAATPATTAPAETVYLPYNPGKPAPVLSAAAASTELAPANDVTLNRRSTAALPDPDAGIVTRVAGPSNELPPGTLLKVRMVEGLSTKATTPGSRFDATLAEAVLRDGQVMLPVGTILSGRVTEVHGGRRIKGAASILLQPQILTLPDGTHYTIHGQVIDTNLYRSTKVDREGKIVRRDHPKETATVLALTTGSAAAAGAVFGGGAGALIGAGVGAGLSTAWWLKQDRQTSLPPETGLTISLTAPLAFPTK